MKPFIERAAKKGLYFLPKLLCILGGCVRLEGIAGPPDGYDREVIQAVHLLDHFKTNAARVLSRICGKFPEHLDRRGEISSACDIYVSHRVNVPRRFCGSLLGGQRRDCSENQ